MSLLLLILMSIWQSNHHQGFVKWFLPSLVSWQHTSFWYIWLKFISVFLFLVLILKVGSTIFIQQDAFFVFKQSILLPLVLPYGLGFRHLCILPLYNCWGIKLCQPSEHPSLFSIPGLTLLSGVQIEAEVTASDASALLASLLIWSISPSLLSSLCNLVTVGVSCSLCVTNTKGSHALGQCTCHNLCNVQPIHFWQLDKYYPEVIGDHIKCDFIIHIKDPSMWEVGCVPEKH